MKLEVKILRELRVKKDTKIHGVQRSIGLVLVFSEQQRRLKFIKQLKVVNEMSNRNRTSFKPYKHKINSKQFND